MTLDATTAIPIASAKERGPESLETSGGPELSDLYEDSHEEFNAGDFERYDDDAPDLRSTNPKRYDPTDCIGRPGLVWYTRVTPVLGADLKPRDRIDSLDHSGARAIYRISPVDHTTGTRIVAFSDCEGDTATIHVTTTYDVVDPTSAVTPDGTPLTFMR